MFKVFIAWGGNQKLAETLAVKFKEKRIEAIVGGGHPKDMFIGTQVINQIRQCSYAILLVEGKEGQISPNLMFEWGYMISSMDIKQVHTFLINMSSRELPSDVLGSWASELKCDRSLSDSDETLAEEIAEIFHENIEKELTPEYFNIIDDWRRIRIELKKYKEHAERDVYAYILFGCLAAYYYNDNKWLYKELGNIVGSTALNGVVGFAKTYVNVFLKSENMSKPLSEEDFFDIREEFEHLLQRERELSETLDDWLDILLYDAYGLACLLYLRSEAEEDVVELFRVQARQCFEKVFELIAKVKEREGEGMLTVKLLEAYMHNDLAHLLFDFFDDREGYLEHLHHSVLSRKALWKDYVSQYPENAFLATKFEQEYMIAYAEECRYMPNGAEKTFAFNSITRKYRQWNNEAEYTLSLISRLKNNLDKITTE